MGTLKQSTLEHNICAYIVGAEERLAAVEGKVLNAQKARDEALEQAQELQDSLVQVRAEHTATSQELKSASAALEERDKELQDQKKVLEGQTKVLEEQKMVLEDQQREAANAEGAEDKMWELQAALRENQDTIDGLNERLEEIPKLQAQIQDVQNAAAASESEAGKIVEEWAQAHADLSAQLQEAQAAEQAALQERQAALDERGGLEERIRVAQAETEDLKAVCEDRLQAMEHAQQAADAMGADVRRLEERTAAAEAGVAAASGAREVAALQQQLQDTEAERVELQKELEEIVPELEGVLADRGELQERVEALQASEGELRTKVEVLEQQAAAPNPGAEMELASACRQLDSTSAENDGLRQERGALQVQFFHYCCALEVV